MRFFLACFLFLGLISTAPLDSQAAGLLAVCATTSIDASSCKPSEVSRPTFKTIAGLTTFNYKVDQGDFGDFSAAETLSDIEDMLDIWADVSNLNFANQGFLSNNATGSNYLDILIPLSELGYSPIILDSDGSIITDLLGGGASQAVLGFAGAVFYERGEDGNIQYIKEAQSLFNGLLYKQENRSDINNISTLRDEFKTTILHEFAHMLGIDHSQGGDIASYVIADSSQYTHFPVMFPSAANPLVELERDDIAAINTAYPKSDFASSTGSITGTVKRKNKGLKSVNIVAYNVNDSTNEVVTSSVDFDGQRQGNFELKGLTPGDYIIKIEPLNITFTGGSSVGLHSPSSNPNVVTRSFYMGEGSALLRTDSLDTALEEASRVSVAAGESKKISLNTGINNGDVTLTLGGKAIRESVWLGIFRPKFKTLVLRKIGGGQKSYKLETDYPDLVRFVPSLVKIPANKKSKKVKVILQSLGEFQDEFDNISTQGALITIKATDLDTGYVDNGNVLFVL